MHGQTIHPSAIGKQFGLINRFRRNNQAVQGDIICRRSRPTKCNNCKPVGGSFNPKRIVVAQIQSSRSGTIRLINQYDCFRTTMKSETASVKILAFSLFYKGITGFVFFFLRFRFQTSVWSSHRGAVDVVITPNQYRPVPPAAQCFIVFCLFYQYQNLNTDSPHRDM